MLRLYSGWFLFLPLNLEAFFMKYVIPRNLRLNLFQFMFYFYKLYGHRAKTTKSNTVKTYLRKITIHKLEKR